MSSPPAPAAPAPELEDELASFRAAWLAETRRAKPPPAAADASTSRHHRPEAAPAVPTSPERARRSLDGDAEGEELAVGLAGVQLDERERAEPTSPQQQAKGKGKGQERAMYPPPHVQVERPKSALELYELAVASEREGRLSDALVNYRSAFRLDPDVDRAYHLATTAAQAHSASRGAEPSHGPSHAQEWHFERTVQLGPDYDAARERRSAQEAQREVGSADADVTHPSSTAFLLTSLLKSIAENPYERPPPPVHAAAPGPTSPRAQAGALPPTSPRGTAATLPPSAEPAPPAVRSDAAVMTPEEALATLHFIPLDEERPLPLAHLPREVLLLILRHLLLSSMLPPPRGAHADPAQEEHRDRGGGKRRLPKRRTLREEMALLEMELELQDADRPWKSDVEALERFARVCRAARVLTLDTGLWRGLCMRTYVPPQQISREESAAQLVKQHGADWRRFYIEHPRIRLDGAYISVVTYLRRGETQSVYAPTHLITFYRYLRFYHHGLALSLLTTDPPGQIVRKLNPTLRMKGLTFGRWRLRGEHVELWGLEDPGVDEDKRKYSFRMTCRLKSTARGRMNKLEMLSMATEHRRTLELEDLPIRPTKPFYFSKVQSYASEDRVVEAERAG
ncbi:hypothetical protein JCM10450v2_003617 [Rhodotorula kratochvilovae]